MGKIDVRNKPGDDLMDGDSMDGDSMDGDSKLGDSMLGVPMKEMPMEGDSVEDGLMLGAPMEVNPMKEDSMMSVPMEDSTMEDSTMEDSTMEDSTMEGDSMMGDPMSEKPKEDVPNGYHAVRLTIDLVKANVLALLLVLPSAVLMGLPYALIWGIRWNAEFVRQHLTTFSPEAMGLGIVAVMLAGIVLHELIHGVVWAMYARRGFRSIRFGVMWKMLTPYCHCKEPLRVRQYIIGALMPALLLGWVPGILAVVFGHPGALLFGIFFTTAAAGDFMIVYLLRKEKADDLVLDHPTEAGCHVFRKTQA